ncbi:AzlC family ABC transporter permease [Priestia koreensis]|uniref:AzlC family ABC transporter permease n=1 Tax=Priestia koreensis TaxID=284581 RepID=UPI001F55FEF3|nr:AzlC family ABC transporter permease [Priestia koreensis]UNL83448.1 AzlC family ABC transporter permease [Priestia koreensis]
MQPTAKLAPPVTSSSLSMYRKGVATALPIVIGYIPIALTFGLLAKQAGIPVFETGMMSLLVFAGASQFMAVNMLSIGTGAFEIIFATFILNFRHFIMNLSLMNILEKTPFHWKLGLSALLTDETFAMAALHQEQAAKKRSYYFFAGIMTASCASWVFGSVIGSLAADFFPKSLSDSMGIALYAMFIGLLVPSVKKEWRYGVIAICSMLLNLFFSMWLSSGWSIVLATILGGAIGMLLTRGGTE